MSKKSHNGSRLPAAWALLGMYQLRWLSMRIFLLRAWILCLSLETVPSQAAVLTGGPTVEFTNGTQAIIRWTTDVSTGTRIFFGESVTGMTRRAQGEQGVNHVAVLPALDSGTKWFFTVGTARVPLATNSFIVPGKNARERGPPQAKSTFPARESEQVSASPPTRETWGYMPSLADHFERHGRDFDAKNPSPSARFKYGGSRNLRPVLAIPQRSDSY